jgi:hypothetical protein
MLEVKMTEEEISVAKKLIQSPNWEWVPGMRVISPTSKGRVFDGGSDYVIWHGEGSTDRGGGYQEESPPSESTIPDLSDAATKGCILHLIRMIMQKEKKEIVVYHDPDVNIWRVKWQYFSATKRHGGLCGKGKSEGIALALSLIGEK